MTFGNKKWHAIWIFPALMLAPRMEAQTKPMISDQAFKNVQVLKGIPLDDFMGTMGVMSGSLSFDCSDCHQGAGTDTVNWALDTQRKVVARKMVTMVARINRDDFSGRQVVTCYSCHHGRDRPATTVALENVYGPPSTDTDDVITQAEGQLPAEQIVDKFIRVIGGAEKLAKLKSYTATGVSVGFGGFGGGARVSLYAKAPDQRTMILDFKDAPGRGDTTRTYDGRTAWLRTPLNVLGEYELSGGELDGARVDAFLSFPGTDQANPDQASHRFAGQYQRSARALQPGIGTGKYFDRSGPAGGCGAGRRPSAACWSICISITTPGCCCAWSAMRNRRSGECRRRWIIPTIATWPASRCPSA